MRQEAGAEGRGGGVKRACTYGSHDVDATNSFVVEGSFGTADASYEGAEVGSVCIIIRYDG